MSHFMGVTLKSLVNGRPRGSASWPLNRGHRIVVAIFNSAKIQLWYYQISFYYKTKCAMKGALFRGSDYDLDIPCKYW